MKRIAYWTPENIVSIYLSNNHNKPKALNKILANGKHQLLYTTYFNKLNNMAANIFLSTPINLSSAGTSIWAIGFV